MAYECTRSLGVGLIGPMCNGASALPTFQVMPSDVHNNERKVTDPITHLPIKIHDATNIELERIPPPPSLTEQKRQQHEDRRQAQALTKGIGVAKSMDELVQNDNFWWDDPLGDQSRTRTQTAIIAAAASGIGAFLVLMMYELTGAFRGQRRGLLTGFVDTIFAMAGSATFAIVVGACALSFHMFQDKKPRRVAASAEPAKDPFQSPRSLKIDRDISHLATHPESAIWLNNLLRSLWPLINPTMFTAVCDMLEDSLQASLPALIQGVKVADIGQGAEPIRILGIRTLDKGSAAQSVEGMEAEEGDFVNMEVAVGYRAKDTSGLKGLRARAANLHIMMEFWLAGGGLKLPVWVEMQGLYAVARLRIQLMSSPPFLSMMTMTLLGSPKISMKCTPLKKGLLNIMDVPGLNGWLLGTIDATIKDMLVAPRSINVDLKAALMGELPKDTDAVGVVVGTIRKAIMKCANNEKHDAYVTVGWSKLGKPVWSTRIISNAVEPVWEETMFLLVGPTELNIQEGLKLELWDSDRFTADDLLGIVEVPLSDLMHNPSTHNRISRKEDQLLDSRGNPARGDVTVIWECGYYSKTTLHEHRSGAEVTRTRADVDKKAEGKLREAIDVVNIQEEQEDEIKDRELLKSEIKQQKDEDFKEKSDAVITGEKPLDNYVCGILSVTIEQIVGLEVQHIRESGVRPEAEQEGGEDQDDLPSAYASVFINQRKVYRTRTKMKESNPYFAAKTEKFIRDWQTTTVIIAVRDTRFHEIDPLLGVVVLPLQEIFNRRNSSIFEEVMPIMGGIGYGKMKLSLMFRSVKLTLPRRMLGWDIGTAEVFSGAKVEMKVEKAAEKAMLEGCRMKFRIGTGEGAAMGNSKGKMVPHHEGEQGGIGGYHLHRQRGDIEWISKNERPVRLPVKNRYASSVVVVFSKGVVGRDQTLAFSTIWLKDVPDDEEVHITAPLYSYRLRRGSIGRKEKQGVKYASMNATAPTDSRVTGHSTEQTDLGSESFAHRDDSDQGESIGLVKLQLCFHSGFSGYHRSLTDKDGSLADAMGVLDCVEGTHGKGRDVIRDTRGDQAEHESATTDSSDDKDSSDEFEQWSMGRSLETPEEGQGHKRGIAKHSKKHRGELNRKHRGLMQWKAARNAVWLGKSVQHTGGKVGERVARPFVGHRERQIGIESEV